MKAAAKVSAMTETEHSTVDTGLARQLLQALDTIRDLRRQLANGCSCAWCCSGSDPELRGQTHRNTCHPKAGTE